MYIFYRYWLMWLKNVISWLILTRSLDCNINLFDFGRFCGAKVKNIFFAIIFVIYVKIAFKLIHKIKRRLIMCNVKLYCFWRIKFMNRSELKFKQKKLDQAKLEELDERIEEYIETKRLMKK